MGESCLHLGPFNQLEQHYVGMVFLHTVYIAINKARSVNPLPIHSTLQAFLNMQQEVCLEYRTKFFPPFLSNSVCLVLYLEARPFFQLAFKSNKIETFSCFIPQRPVQFTVIDLLTVNSIRVVT